MAIDLATLRILLLAVMVGGSSASNSQKELRTKEMNQDQIIRLSHPVQPKSIDPSQVIQLSWQPRAFFYRGFLSEEECDYLIYWGNGKKSYAMRGDDSLTVDMNNIRNDLGNSMDADDEIARRIEERISSWTFLPKENSKPLSIQHFGPESSKQNYHYFDTRSVEQVGEPLLATVILYLSNVSQGGQLLFPQSKSDIWSDCTENSNILRPRKGNAIVFFNLHLNATPDRSSHHGRCPVLQGDLWFATKFFYLKRISSKKDQPRSDGADCSDEDENCPGWAAIAEETQECIMRDTTQKKNEASDSSPCEMFDSETDFLKLPLLSVLSELQIICTDKGVVKPHIPFSHNFLGSRHHFAVFKAPEESNGESIHTFPEDDSVLRRHQHPIAPCLHQVTNVDDERVFAWTDVHPLPFLGPHLEPTNVVLIHQGYAAHIRVHA